MEATLFPEVVVDGEVVPRTAIAAEAQNHAAPKGKPGIAWRKAARALVMRALLLQEARRRGIEAEPKAVGPGRRETEEEALIRGLLEAAVAVAPPEEAEIRAVWARDPERYRSPGLREASHILCASDPSDEAAFAAARTRAEALIARLHDDSGVFGRLAKAESACGSAASGGLLGQLRPGDVMPEVEAALSRLSPGEIGPEPVASRFGWHVLRLDAAE